MKKLLSFALALLLLFTICILSACDPSDNPGGETPSGPSIEDPSTDPEPDDPEPDEPDDGWVSAVFGSRPFVTGGVIGMDNVSSAMKNAGYNTMIIWSVHVRENGTIFVEHVKVCENGELVDGDVEVPVIPNSDQTVKMSDIYSYWAGLKKGKSTIKRVEISIGAWECYDFDAIKTRIEEDGDGEDTVLYKNFQKLIEVTGADAVNFDDETCYDINSATKFGRMIDRMGAKVALCPFKYEELTFWSSVRKNLGDIVDRVYLQLYDGGAPNLSPMKLRTWYTNMGMKLILGYFCAQDESMNSKGYFTAQGVAAHMTQYLDYITGGFMWMYNNMQAWPSPNSLNDFADAINSVNPNNVPAASQE